MEPAYLVPLWFLGYDVAFEAAFAIIALLVSFYAFKVHRISGQTQPRLFAWSFLFISASYFVQSVLNLIVVSELNESIHEALGWSDASWLNDVGMYLHILLFITGLVTLTYMTLNVRSRKTYSLIVVLVLLTLFVSMNRLLIFYVISSVLLIYVLLHYAANFWYNRQAKTLLVLAAFALILFGSIHFTLSVNHSLYYVIGHFLGLIAYLLILLNLILVVKHEQKEG